MLRKKPAPIYSSTWGSIPGRSKCNWQIYPMRKTSPKSLPASIQLPLRNLTSLMSWRASAELILTYKVNSQKKHNPLTTGVMPTCLFSTLEESSSDWEWYAHPADLFTREQSKEWRKWNTIEFAGWTGSPPARLCQTNCHLCLIPIFSTASHSPRAAT